MHTPQDILKEAAKCGFLEKAAKEMANARLSDREAAQRAAELVRRAKRLSISFYVFCGIAFAITLATFSVEVFGSMVPAKATTVVGQYAEKAFGVAFLTGVFSLCWLIPGAVLKLFLANLWANRDQMRMLEPIAGTYQCQRVLEYLEHGGPIVTRWRDVALTERNQLYGFDFDVMQALKVVYEEDQRSAKLSLVCKKVHGLLDDSVPESQSPAVSA